MKILIVDDEKEIAGLIEVYLKKEGYDTVICHDGSKALEIIAREEFDLAILDVMLPGTDGFTICEAIRKNHTYPVIMLTAKTAYSDRISGLSIGADDYVTKPFNPPELIARVNAQLRRYHRYSNAEKNEDIFEYSGLTVNKSDLSCLLYGEKISLTKTEFRILWHLLENKGKAVTTEELFEKVWGEEYLDSNNTVMVHIRRIREKLHEKPKSPKFIKTVWGVGYKIEKE